MVQEERSFKDICVIYRGHYEEQFSNLGQWFRKRWHLIDLIWSSDGPPVQLSGTIYAILKEGIMGNIQVKLI